MELSTHSGSPSASRTLDIVPQPGGLRRLLRVPLLVKLAGANLLVVVATWATVYATNRTTTGEWRMLGIITVVLVAGLVVNLALVAVALRPIRDLERTAMRVWAGDLETRVPQSPVSDADLEQVGGTLNFLLSALARDRARVRMLASEVVRTADRERARVGRELHDSVAQAIAALRFQLIALEREAANTEFADRLEALRLSAGTLLEEVRLLSHTVHPQILDDLGIVPALRHLVRTTNGRASIVVTVSKGTDAELRAIPTDAAAALYWIAREAIANATRHGLPHSIEVVVGVADGLVAMHVDDDGSGFDSATAEREGSAMGLFTMRERAALVDGTFEIDSTPRGTSVRVSIPIRSAGYARTEKQRPSPPTGDPLMPGDVIRVMLVDDHAVVRAGLRAVLGQARDISVIGEATNGKEAVALAERFNPDVVIMDLSMPDMDGAAATKAILAKNSAVRVLVLTMHAEEEYLLPLLEAGAAGYLVKSAADLELVSAVRAVAHGDPYVSASASHVLIRGLTKKDPAQVDRDRYNGLTQRERDVLRLVAQGYSAPEIGEQLFISPKTVDTYKQRVNEKLGISHRSEYVDFALKIGVLGQPSTPPRGP